MPLDQDSPAWTRELALAYESGAHGQFVLYGNVGSASRLDFTTIGPAVNLTARLETLARDLGRELVLSAAFAAASREPARPLGRFELRGIVEPQEVFAPTAG